MFAHNRHYVLKVVTLGPKFAVERTRGRELVEPFGGRVVGFAVSRVEFFTFVVVEATDAVEFF